VEPHFLVMCALKFLIDALLCRLHGEKSSGHGAGEAISSYNSYSRLVSNALGCQFHILTLRFFGLILVGGGI